MTPKLKVFSIATVLLNTIYLAWFTDHIESSLGWLLLGAELLILSNLLIFIYNTWDQKIVAKSDLPAIGNLDIFLTVVNEPIELFEKTLEAASRIDYNQKSIYVLDDGRREQINQLAKQYNAHYITRPTREHNKAGNLNFGLSVSNSEFILVMDADQIAKPAIAKDTLGFFNDSQMALVTTRQSFAVPSKDFNHDNLFYNHIQAGGNLDNAAFSNGSGVLYRRTALEKVGGFDTWNLVEDLTTSYKLHRAGYKSVYVNTAYSIGTAPMSVPTIYKQRGTWALDTLRLLFKMSPLTVKGLSLRQRIHYFEICWQYIVSAISTPILCLLPSLSLFLDIPIIPLDKEYIFFRGPSIALIFYYYYLLNGKSFASGQYWTALFYTYLKALVLALVGKKTKYIVTNKRPVSKASPLLVLPHLLLIFFSLSALIWRTTIVDKPLEGFIGVYIFWFSMMLFWFYPLIKNALLPNTTLEKAYLDKLQQEPFKLIEDSTQSDTQVLISKTATIQDI